MHLKHDAADRPRQVRILPMTAPLTVLHPTRAMQLDPRTYDRALSCVHCGLCLPACPTYTETLHEADSPRGRIQLMRGLAEGVIEATPSVREHLDLCLDCRACETACPSGVVYHELIEETRARLSKHEKPSLQSSMMRWMFFHVLTHPARLKLALLPARLLQRLGLYALLRKLNLFRWLPAQLQKMEQMLPAKGPLWPMPLPAVSRSLNRSKAAVRVGFFGGCVGSVMFDPTNRMAIELLTAAGADVIVPSAAVCCGAIHHPNGAHEAAMEFARKNIDAFGSASPPLDYVVTNIAGCGAMLREYDFLLRDDPMYAARAAEFVGRVRDISELLVHLGLPPMRYPVNETVTYHDACHLAHAQKVVNPPRELLAMIPGLKIVPLHESDMCCGAAGTYNLTQPQMAAQLADRKLRNIAATGSPICIAGNAGCSLHIQSAANQQRVAIQVVHPVELLHRAVFGPKSTGN
jgi:glycolate oxidase iron-sulfur subunit